MVNQKEQTSKNNTILEFSPYDQIDSSWDLFPGAIVARTGGAYHDGPLLNQSDNFQNVFCGPPDECIIRYQTPADYLQEMTGLIYTFNVERWRKNSPEGTPIDPGKETWYRIDPPPAIRKVTPENPYGALIVFSRTYLKLHQELIGEKIERLSSEYKKRLKDGLGPLAQQIKQIYFPESSS